MESVNSVVAMEIVEDEINQPIIPPRHAAIEETLKSEEETDRISTLPDGLLLEILSRLPSTESVIRTSTLSKRWRYVWTSVPTLIFKHSYTHLSYFKHFHDKRQLSDFVTLVDKTLNQRCRSKLRKFTVCTRYDVRFALHVNNWIHYAISCNVEELKLRFSNLRSQPQFLLNEYFFSNSCFTDLKLHGCMFNPNGAISWKNLRSLRISNGNLNEDLIKNILSGSPLLENLILDYCYGYRRLDITSKSVKNLVLSGFRDPNNEFEVADVIEITAPNILSFKVLGNLLVRKIVLLNMSSLVGAELNCIKVGHWETIWKEEMLKAFIEKLSHAKELKIGSYCSADVLRLGAKGFDFPSNVEFASVTYAYTDSGETSGRDNDLSD